MKAIIENKETYKITGERGDFYITENNRGKVKMFAKSQVDVIDIESLPKVKKYSAGRVPSDAAHAAFMRKLNMSQLEDTYLDCQISDFKRRGLLNDDNTFKI